MSFKILLTGSYKGDKIARAANKAAHRRLHIKRAEHMRQEAEEWLKFSRNAVIRQEGFISTDMEIEINRTYNNMLAEAIAEENAKCMDKH